MQRRKKCFKKRSPGSEKMEEGRRNGRKPAGSEAVFYRYGLTIWRALAPRRSIAIRIERAQPDRMLGWTRWGVSPENRHPGQWVAPYMWAKHVRVAPLVQCKQEIICNGSSQLVWGEETHLRVDARKIEAQRQVTSTLKHPRRELYNCTSTPLFFILWRKHDDNLKYKARWGYKQKKMRPIYTVTKLFNFWEKTNEGIYGMCNIYRKKGPPKSMLGESPVGSL